MGEERPPALATLAIHGGGQGSTAAAFEQRLSVLEGGTAAVAAPAGVGVLQAALQPLMRPGSEIVASGDLPVARAGTLAEAFQGFGWQARLADLDDVEAFAGAIGPKTQAILVPSLAASGAFADLDGMASLAKRAGVPLIVDNTWLTPALCRPVDFGADIVLYADTSFLCGGPTGIGFIVDGGRFKWLGTKRYPAISERRAADGDGLALAETIGNFAYATAARLALQGFDGMDPAPATAGMETLPLRMVRHAENARTVAEFLAGHRRIAAVSHAGLAGDRHHRLAAKYCPEGAGALVAFTLESGQEGAAAFRRRLRLVAPDRSARTASTSLVEPGGRRTEAAPGSLTMFVGLEDPRDVIADLDVALAD
jgi:O-acetylhomoserine (thiol)-lyase